eukprot:COSAG04_NODE_44_length_31776_cov_9.320769_8_plen_159_part_00
MSLEIAAALLLVVARVVARWRVALSGSAQPWGVSHRSKLLMTALASVSCAPTVTVQLAVPAPLSAVQPESEGPPTLAVATATEMGFGELRPSGCRWLQRTGPRVPPASDTPAAMRPSMVSQRLPLQSSDSGSVWVVTWTSSGGSAPTSATSTFSSGAT